MSVVRKQHVDSVIVADNSLVANSDDLIKRFQRKSPFVDNGRFSLIRPAPVDARFSCQANGLTASRDVLTSSKTSSVGGVDVTLDTPCCARQITQILSRVIIQIILMSRAHSTRTAQDTTYE